jgi:hypothetical protein
MSVAAVAILVAVLVALDPRVRDSAAQLMKHRALSAGGSRMNADMHAMASVLMVSAREQSLDHTSLVVFVIVAAGLVVAMLRL